ncbi:hypothetical protein G5C51_40690, partial [Streptomyces sp. A7024]|nr:hypothetical protein [Streptomyces coryli]
MPWSKNINRERWLLAVEVDVNYGLVEGRGIGVVADASVRVVWAWSPRARVVALGPGVGRG